MMYRELLKKHVGKKCEINQGHNFVGCEIIIQEDGVHEILRVTDEYIVLSEPPCGDKVAPSRLYRIFLIDNTSLVTDMKTN